MAQLIAPLFVLVLFVLVFCTDLFITALKASDVVRAIAYGLLALLALISALVSLGVRL